MEINYDKPISPLAFNMDVIQQSSYRMKQLTQNHNRLVDIRREALDIPEEYINPIMNHAFKISKDESRKLLVAGCEDGIRKIRLEMMDERKKLRESLKDI